MLTSNKSRSNSRIPALIALTGFMASGKTTVGHALAFMLNWRFVDLDSEIEYRSKRSIREIFAEHGENRFREIEAEALRSVLEGAAGATVIALGGGTFVQPQNTELLRHWDVRIVFLELPLEQLLQRCRAVGEPSGLNPRPLAANEQALCALYAQRLPLYRQADLVVNTQEKTPDQIAREIAKGLGFALPASGS